MKAPRAILVTPPPSHGLRVRPPWELDTPADLGALLAVLGGDSVVLAAYDARLGVSTTAGAVDSWADARNVNGGPALVAVTTARPTLTSAGLVFDGVANFLRNATAGRLAEVVDDCWIAYVGTIPATAASNRVFYQMTANVATHTLSSFVTATTGLIQGRTNAAPTAGGIANPGDSLIHSILVRRTQAGANVTVGVQVGSGAEATFTQADAAVVPGRLTLATTSADVPSAFAPFTLRAYLVGKGSSAGVAASVAAWALANHGAVLT